MEISVSWDCFDVSIVKILFAFFWLCFVARLFLESILKDKLWLCEIYGCETGSDQKLLMDIEQAYSFGWCS